MAFLNLSQMRQQVYELVGEPEDLGTGATPAAGGRIDEVLNIAQRRIANWRFPDGHLLRFPGLYGVMYFKSVVKSGTVAAGDSISVTLDSGVLSNASRYNGWLVELDDGQKRIVTSFAASRVCMVHKSWDTIPDASNTYTLYKRTYRIVRSWETFAADEVQINDYGEILKVEDMHDETEIVVAGRTDAVIGWCTDSGVPSNWIPYGDKIVFDTNVNDQRWFRLEYYKQPTALSSGTDRPVAFGEGIDHGMILYARWALLARAQESSEAYSAKKDFEDWILTMRKDKEMASERIDAGLKVKY